MRAKAHATAIALSIIFVAAGLSVLRLTAGDDPRMYASLITVPVYLPAQGEGEARAGPHQRSGPRARRSLPPAIGLESPGSFRLEPSWSAEKTEQW